MKNLIIIAIALISLSSCTKLMQYDCTTYVRDSNGSLNAEGVILMEFDSRTEKEDYVYLRNSTLPNGTVFVCVDK